MLQPMRDLRRNLALLVLALAAGCGGGGAPALPQAWPDGTVEEHVHSLAAGADDAAGAAEVAMALEANEIWDEAAAWYAHAVELEPTRALWDYHRALALRNRGSTDEARELLERTAARLPSEPAVHQRLGYWRLEEERLEEATESFRRLAELLPRAGEGAAGLGEIALRRDELREALGLLEQAVRLDPGLRSAHYALGRVYAGLGREEEAARSLARGSGAKVRFLDDPLAERVRSHARSVPVVLRLANQHLVQGRPGPSAEMLGALSLRHPDDVSVLSNLATAQLALGAFPSAQRSIERALALEPERAFTHLLSCAALTGQRRLDEALAAAERAIELAPELGKAHFEKAKVLGIRGRWDEARSSLERALELDRRDPTVFLALADVLLRSGAPAEALLQVDEALALDPDSVQGHVTHAWVLARLGRADDARRARDRALALAPSHPAVVDLNARLDTEPR